VILSDAGSDAVPDRRFTAGMVVLEAASLQSDDPVRRTAALPPDRLP
jgi:hypothetical protein